MLSYFLGLRNYHHTKRKVRGNNYELTKKLREVHFKSDSVDRASTLKCQIWHRNQTEMRFPKACVCNFLFLSQMITCLEHRLFQTSTTNKLHTHKDSQQKKVWRRWRELWCKNCTQCRKQTQIDYQCKAWQKQQVQLNTSICNHSAILWCNSDQYALLSI